jgi:protein-S-isoprenylcysteine O-methyltransferase Ste14
MPMSDSVQQDTDTAGVVARPPLIYLGYLAAGFVLNYFWPWRFIGDGLAPDIRIAIGAAVAAAGIAIGVIAFIQFRRAGTAVPTWQPTTALVTGGLYRYSRNPIYVAQTLVYLGITLIGDNLWALLLIAPALMMIRYGVIAREEMYLERRFGADYSRYTMVVRRWL